MNLGDALPCRTRRCPQKQAVPRQRAGCRRGGTIGKHRGQRIDRGVAPGEENQLAIQGTRRKDPAEEQPRPFERVWWGRDCKKCNWGAPRQRKKRRRRTSRRGIPQAHQHRSTDGIIVLRSSAQGTPVAPLEISTGELGRSVVFAKRRAGRANGSQIDATTQ